MKPYNNLYASTWIVLMLFWGCDKGPNLTPTTQEGKNTFSCKVDGKVWIPNGTGDWFGVAKAINGGFAGYGSHIPPTIFIRTYSKDKTVLHVFLKTIEVGIHELDQDTYKIDRDFYPESYGWYQGADGISFMTSRNHTGRVVITKADTISGIVSGTFEFEGGNSLGKKVKITDGRFDVNTKTVNL